MISETDLRAKVNEEVKHLHGVISEKESQLTAYKKEHGKLESFFREVRSCIKPIDPSEILYVKPRKSSLTTCEAVMQSSDGHMGAVQEPDEIEGFGEFNPEICEWRQVKFVADVLDWVEMHRHSFKIPTLNHIVTGDMISGDIHLELQNTNAFPAPVQTVRAGALLAKQIAMAAPHFEKVVVHFIVEDNHSRLTKKPQAKEAGLNTYNYLVGEIAKAYLSAHKNVRFNLYPMHEKVVHVCGRQYLICHGHGVMGWAGVPWYGIERKVSREATARLQIIMKDQQKAQSVGFHKYIFGHWHTPIALPMYWGAGSVQGTDAYDHKSGRYGVPSQPAWIVHPKHGEFDRTDFNL